MSQLALKSIIDDDTVSNDLSYYYKYIQVNKERLHSLLDDIIKEIENHFGEGSDAKAVWDLKKKSIVILTKDAEKCMTYLDSKIIDLMTEKDIDTTFKSRMFSETVAFDRVFIEWDF